MAAAEGRALATHQLGAVVEHRFRICDSISAPLATSINGRQSNTVAEHILHVCHLGCVETAQVKTRQTSAIIECEVSNARYAIRDC